MASKFNTGYSFNTTKLTKKITKDSKKNKFKIKPPEFIYIDKKTSRGIKKRKVKNPKYAEWLKRNQKIDQQVNKYVKDRKVPINKDLTIDNSKKNKKVVNNNKEVKDNKEVKKTNEGQSLEQSVKYLNRNKNENEVRWSDFESKETKETPDKKKGSGKKESRWIRTGNKGLARRGSVGARKAERKEAARKKAQRLAKERIAAKKNKLKVGG